MPGVIEQKHLDAARAKGACEVAYTVGQPLEALTPADAAWFEKHCPELALEIELAQGHTLYQIAIHAELPE